MPLTDKPEIDECVKVRIKAELSCKGCFFAIAHGWAVSVPGGDKLDRVFLVGDDIYPDLQESIGAELSDGFVHDPLEQALGQALWAKARTSATTVALTEAFADAQTDAADARSGSREDHRRNMRDEVAA
jgi:hypothetical protein